MAPLLEVATLLHLLMAVAVEIPSDHLLDDDLDNAMQKWKNNYIPNYRYEIAVVAYDCSYPTFQVTVSDGKVIELKYDEKMFEAVGDSECPPPNVAKDDFAIFRKPIANLFQEIINYKHFPVMDAIVPTTAKFHPIYGFPVVFRVDYSMDKKTSLESDYNYRINSFVAL